MEPIVQTRFDKLCILEYLKAMDHDDVGGQNGIEAFERWLKANAERLRESNGRLNLGELSELPDEDRQMLLKILAWGAGIGLGALGLYLGKRAADGIARSDLPEALRQLEGLPAEIVERIRAGWNGTSRRGQRIIIPDE